MNIEELSEQLYEDLNGFINSISINNEYMTIAMECDDWANQERKLNIQLLCKGVRESTINVGPISFVKWQGEHVVLSEYSEEHVHLYFSSAPKDPYSVIGHLYTAHQSFFSGWRPFTMHIHASATILADGNGLLARGPRSLIEILASSVEGQLHVNIVKSYSPNSKYMALILDDTFVICESISLVESTANMSFNRDALPRAR